MSWGLCRCAISIYLELSAMTSDTDKEPLCCEPLNQYFTEKEIDFARCARKYYYLGAERLPIPRRVWMNFRSRDITRREYDD